MLKRIFEILVGLTLIMLLSFAPQRFASNFMGNVTVLGLANDVIAVIQNGSSASSYSLYNAKSLSSNFKYMDDFDSRWRRLIGDARSISFEHCKIDSNVATQKDYTIYKNFKGERITKDEWDKLDNELFNKLYKEKGYDKIADQFSDAGLTVSNTLADKFFDTAIKLDYEVNQIMPKPEIVYKKVCYITITTQDGSSIMVYGRLIDGKYYLEGYCVPELSAKTDK